jgi:hypothetical protein
MGDTALYIMFSQPQQSDGYHKRYYHVSIERDDFYDVVNPFGPLKKVRTERWRALVYTVQVKISTLVIPARDMHGQECHEKERKLLVRSSGSFYCGGGN